MARSRQQHFVPKNQTQALILKQDQLRVALARAQHILQMILDDEQGWSTRDVERALMAIEEVMP